MSQHQLEAILRKLSSRQDKLDTDLRGILKACMEAPRSITEEIDALPGRRIFYNLSDEVDFTIEQDGLRGDPLQVLVSQDGPYIMTGYPVLSWRPTAPAGATNFGQWSAIYSWPLPAQDQPLRDSINLSYELIDSGSQRKFDNEPSAPITSRFDSIQPLPVPTLFSPNTVISLFPTYEDIAFAATAVPAVGGTLRLTLPGYRIINL
jgi:hypothetical protein